MLKVSSIEDIVFGFNKEAFEGTPENATGKRRRPKKLDNVLPSTAKKPTEPDLSPIPLEGSNPPPAPVEPDLSPIPLEGSNAPPTAPAATTTAPPPPPPGNTAGGTLQDLTKIAIEFAKKFNTQVQRYNPNIQLIRQISQQWGNRPLDPAHQETVRQLSQLLQQATAEQLKEDAFLGQITNTTRDLAAKLGMDESRPGQGLSSKLNTTPQQGQPVANPQYQAPGSTVPQAQNPFTTDTKFPPQQPGMFQRGREWLGNKIRGHASNGMPILTASMGSVEELIGL